MKVMALIAAHNRRSKTLACLGRLNTQRGDVSLGAVLLDDGSTDGTAESVASEFPWVEVLRGDGSRYWNRGTRDAFVEAWKHAPDFYLWLNDDTMLDKDALVRLLDAYRAAVEVGRDGILVGSVRDPESGEPTYGGVRRSSRWFRPIAFSLVMPTEGFEDADTMNGNCVLIPRSVAARIGVNAAAYTHAMGDFDYGLRARHVGFAVTVAPATFGSCPRNLPAEPTTGALLERLRTQWRSMSGPKGLPPREWAVFLRRWGGPFWPLFWLSPYFRHLVAAARGKA